jgi:hypothetical protein
MDYSDVTTLAEQRAQARADKDFARADELRDAIDAAGWRVLDTADGFELVEKPPFDVFATLGDVDSAISAPIVVTVIADGWPDDLDTCMNALVEHAPVDAVILVLDCGNVESAGERAEEWAKANPQRVRVVHLERTLMELGWAAVVSTAIDISSCDVFAVMDMSTVLEGDAFPALLAELESDGVVATGWKGVNVDVDDGWRSFVSADSGQVDAVLGYLMVLDRDAIEDVRPNPKAKFYRNADMEWSLALRQAGGVIAVPRAELPIRQDRHHGYHDSDPSYRDKQSKKTYDRLLQQFRGRTEILAPR